MIELICCECKKLFKADHPPVRLPRGQEDVDTPLVGMCLECFDGHIAFSDKSMAKDRSIKKKEIRKVMKEKFDGNITDDRINITGKDIEIKFNSREIVVTSKVRLSYFTTDSKHKDESAKIINTLIDILKNFNKES